MNKKFIELIKTYNLNDLEKLLYFCELTKNII